jgi:methylenetetrahydrofolate dehydrogenase (NADP+)/methenyltetrahydrofolate cyclohydrolase
MNTTILDGKATAATIRTEIAAEVAAFRKTHGFPPGLAVVLVGDNPASQTYVRNKHTACEKAGMHSEIHNLPADVGQEEILELIARLNNDGRIHGILVQLPLPRHLDEFQITCAISPEKDVDGFHPLNVGRLYTGKPCLAPCTPRGIIELLDRYDISVEGRQAVVVGRSDIVGKPVALLLLQRNATVTVCHSRTADLAAETARADILVVAVGRPRMIKVSMVKEGAVVIDVGINYVDGKLVGDVDFEEVAPRAGAITPVPGGIGPMTIAMLLANTLQAARTQVGDDTRR